MSRQKESDSEVRRTRGAGSSLRGCAAGSPLPLHPSRCNHGASVIWRRVWACPGWCGYALADRGGFILLVYMGQAGMTTKEWIGDLAHRAWSPELHLLV